MRMSASRREFLKLSALGVASAASARSGFAQLAPQKPDMPGSVRVWTTDRQRRCAQAPSVVWKSGKSAAAAIALYPDKTFQTVLGFGGAFTDAACYMLNQLSPSAREPLLHEMFHPSAMDLSVCRTCMGASDYSTSAYTYDDGLEDLTLERFSIAHDRQYILPILREARAINPDLFLLATPWSPPGWMKSGGSLLGGSMRKKYLPLYAQYFTKFLKAYEAEGVPIQAVTSQNEVDTDQDARMPACLWGQEYEIEFVKLLGQLMEQNKIATKIWILDHNYNLWGRAVCELDDPELRKYCKDVAWHGYYGTPEMVSTAHELHPEASMHWTEGGPDFSNPDYLTDWTKWGHTFTGALRNWCDSITAWNLALDERGKPNIGPFPCGGVVTIHSKTKEITRSGQFWALAQFSRFIRRGARRFDTQGTVAGLDHVAFENPDGKRVLVLGNSDSDKRVSLQLGDMSTDLDLQTDSLTTLVWN